MIQVIVSWLGVAMVFVLGYVAGVVHTIYMGKCDKFFGGDK
jgi:uncharacterized membrane protein YqaE (UPF0057 family)